MTKQRRCIECGKVLNYLTRGRWGPDHWCNDCDTRRVERISRELEEMVAEGKAKAGTTPRQGK